MANLNLKFFNKRGNPLNFNYVGPTGPTPLDSGFTYILTTGTSSSGDFDIVDFGNYYEFSFNINDLNSFNIVSWYEEAADFINKGASVLLSGRVVGAQQFEGRISSIVKSGNVITATLLKKYYHGQSIISNGNQIYFKTFYENRPGGYFKGNIYFDPVSTGLYENEQIFIVQEVDSSSGKQYVLPHSGVTGATGGGKWRSRWYNDNYGETDVTEIIFTYSINEELTGGDGEPLIVSYPNMVFPVDVDPNDYFINGFIYTSTLNSEALSVNVALNASDEAESVYERKLIVEDISSGTPEKVLEVDFYGQVIGEDERFKVMLENLGRAFYKTDSIILRDHNPDEPLPNFLEINEKRKELLVAGEELFPYIGSYRGLISAIKFFGYQDLRIKEYWLNLEYKSLKLESPLQQNQSFLNAIKAQEIQNGYTLGYSIADVLDNPNSGKYRMTQTYGPDKDGNYVLDVSSEDTLVPSRTYKKTSLFGLYYDLNKITSKFDEYGYPVVVDAFNFTQEEVLLKLFALKQRLKQDYLPLNARIIDITGEGIYFEVYNTRSWTDFMERSEVNSGFYFDFLPNPDFGFLEDLRNFSIRPLPDAIQTPSSYNNSYSATVDFLGGTSGSAIYIGDGIPGGSTGPNPTITLTAGKTYEFNVKDSLSLGYSFVITTDPGLTQIDPLGIVNNGATGGNSITWYVEPGQGSPVYYYSPESPVLMNGTILIQTSSLSDLGNIVNPLDSQQIYSVAANQSLISAINQFYYLKQNDLLVELGDDIYDPNSYIDPLTGQPYVNPVGMPVILEISVDPWTWDELNINWSSISIPTFHIGDRVQVRVGIYSGVFGSVTAVSYSTGIYTVLLDGYGFTQVFDVAELFSSIQDYQTLTWQNIDFSNSLEIEWIVDKSPNQPGSPYHFEFRGLIYDYYRLAHFLPYTGSYDVTCNVYDSFNFKNSLIKKSALVVQPKVIDIDSWTRYREVEFYIWQNVDRQWDQYNSIWEYPAEGETIDQVAKKIPREILDFATYGNKSEEGQSVFVRTDLIPSGATGAFSFTQNEVSILEIYSDEIFAGQYGYVTITTTIPHGLSNGDEVTLRNTIPQLEGRWVALVSGSATTFRIQTVLDPSWSGVILQVSPNKLVVSNILYPAQTATGIGTITIKVGGRIVGTAETGDFLENTAAAVTSAVNSLKTYPDYLAQCDDPTLNPVSIVISAPSDLGDQQNGVSMEVIVTGAVTLVSSDPVLSGGVNINQNYVYWSENDPNYPNPNLKYWGTKRINWNVFTENTWDDGYAHSWFDFEYDNDWLGGYELHSIRPGDYVKVSTGNETYPFPTGVTFTSLTPNLTLQEVADQLNNSLEPHITNFYYRPNPSDTGSLYSYSGPINVEVTNNLVGNSSYPPPPSLIGGSKILLASFGYTGGTPITTSTTTSTTSTTSTSTTSTSTTSTSTSTTSTSTTSTSTTSTSTSTTSTSTTSTSTSTTSTSTTSTTTTTTIAPGYWYLDWDQA